MVKKIKKKKKMETKTQPPQSRPRDFTEEQINLFREGKSQQVFDELALTEKKRI